MTKLRFTCGVAALTFMLLAFTSLAQAQAQRTFVSTSGNDANTASNCRRGTPCRQFAAAITATAAGGEIVVLDSGGYGPVTITQSVSIIAPEGVYACVRVSSGPGIRVDAAGATVVLKGLTIYNETGGTDGIAATAVSALHVENNVINGFNNINGAGIYFNADGQLFVRATTVRNNYHGIIVKAPSGTTARASISDCHADKNGTGVYASHRSQVMVSNTVVAGARSDDTGFFVHSNEFGVTAELNCERCVASNLDTGYWVQTVLAFSATAIIRVARSTATNNNFGFLNNGGPGTDTFESLRGTNLVAGNLINTFGTMTAIDPAVP